MVRTTSTQTFIVFSIYSATSLHFYCKGYPFETLVACFKSKTHVRTTVIIFHDFCLKNPIIIFFPTFLDYFFRTFLIPNVKMSHIKIQCVFIIITGRNKKYFHNNKLSQFWWDRGVFYTGTRNDYIKKMFLLCQIYVQKFFKVSKDGTQCCKFVLICS